MNPLNILINSFTSKFRMMGSKIKAIPKRLNTIYRKYIQKFVKKVFKFFTTKPSKKSDYVKFGELYISKKALVIASLIVIALTIIIAVFVYPWADGHLWTATVTLNSEKYHSFSGKAKVKDQTGALIYEGEMSEGKITGTGKQYDYEGNLIYSGQFENSQYSGVGTQYSGGVMIYHGQFSKNLYEGQGDLYDEEGNLIYSGNFSLGQRSGKGIEYNPSTGTRKYYGDFVNDLKEGKGILYSDDGKLTIYDGDFKSDLYDGSGKLFENGVLKYQGGFSVGLYEGEGTLYDINTKKPIYNGNFSKGLYEGEGTLYDPNTSKIIYTGQFTAGQREGTGSSYDKLGGVKFNGEFKEDNINYLKYLNSPLDAVTEQFGKESYRTETSGKLILTYLSLDLSVIFEISEDDGQYICEKFITGMRDTFMGLKSNSSREEIESVMGSTFSSVNFNFPTYYDKVFDQLSIDLSSSKSAPSDKFLMDTYFVRFYYNDNKTEILSIEICSL